MLQGMPPLYYIGQTAVLPECTSRLSESFVSGLLLACDAAGEGKWEGKLPSPPHFPHSLRPEVARKHRLDKKKFSQLLAKKPLLVYVRKKRAARRNFPKLWKMNGEKSSFSFSLAPSSWKRRLERVTKAAWILSFPADTIPPQRPSSELHHSRRYFELNNRMGPRAGGGCLQRRKEGGIM